MLAIALRNLWARKLRSFLTAFAVVLGVMMIAGTYVLTDTIEASFDDIFTEANEGVDAVVSSDAPVESQDGIEPPIDAATAKDEGYEVGDTVTVADTGATAEYTVSGIGKLGNSESLGGATFVVLTLPEARRVTGKEGQFDQIQIAADEETSPERLAA